MAKPISLSQKIWEAHLAGDTNAQIQKRLKVSKKTVYQAIYLKRREAEKKGSTSEAKVEEPIVSDDSVREQAWERYKEAYVIKAITLARLEFDKWWGK